MTPTNIAQLLMFIDETTLIGTTKLKSVRFNTSTTISTSGLPLSSFLYTLSLIEFTTLSSNLITFTFNTLPIHKQIIVRIRAYT